MAWTFMGRQKVKTRAPQIQQAVVDTAGMDPAMKSTLFGMRGAVGAGSQTDPFAGFKNFFGTNKAKTKRK